jgi:hypothetical protein
MKINKTRVEATLRWVPEIDTKNRPKGDGIQVHRHGSSLKEFMFRDRRLALSNTPVDGGIHVANPMVVRIGR